MPDCQERIYSNEYADYIIEPLSDIEDLLGFYGDVCYESIAELLGVVHIPRTPELPELWEAYRSFPKCYGLLDTSNLEAIGVERLRRQPYLDLYGQGVIVGVIDTGIDYTHPAFRYGDGSSRILEIWDQTIPYTGEQREPQYGTVYTRKQLNTALSEANPFASVPTRDTNGHGTFLAGVAAGNQMERENFSGVAPLADIAVVRLKEAKPYLREYYRIPEGVPCYQETDLLLAVNYLLRLGTREAKPVVILLALGTNQGGHTGRSYLAAQLAGNQQIPGRCVCLPAGNEVGYGRHYRGYMSDAETVQELEFRVGDRERGFIMEMWADITDNYSLGFVTPTGYETGRIPFRAGKIETFSFAFEPVTIEVAYGIFNRYTGDMLTGMRFLDPTPGLWKLRVYRENGTALDGRYDIWLPMKEFASEETRFMRPDPNTTICDPGNAAEPVTTAAYNHRNGSIFLHSSRGFTRENGIKPDITAPGVNIYGPVPGGGFAVQTGTSVAAAQAAGAAALLLEYAPGISGAQIRLALIRGAKRTMQSYPNQEWGYGILDIYRTIEIMGGRRRT